MRDSGPHVAQARCESVPSSRVSMCSSALTSSPSVASGFPARVYCSSYSHLQREPGREAGHRYWQQALTGIVAADFSRIRNADLSRFTIDRLMMIVNGLGFRIDVAVKFRRALARRQVLRKSLIDGENSGDAGVLSIREIKSRARRR